MPLYRYRCKEGHLSEEIKPVSERHIPVTCTYCGGSAAFILSTPSFRLSWVPTVCDSPKDIWGDIKCMDGVDGKNPLTYKSDKPFLDMKSKGYTKKKAKTLADL